MDRITDLLFTRSTPTTRLSSEGMLSGSLLRLRFLFLTSLSPLLKLVLNFVSEECYPFLVVNKSCIIVEVTDKIKSSAIHTTISNVEY